MIQNIHLGIILTTKKNRLRANEQTCLSWRGLDFINIILLTFLCPQILINNSYIIGVRQAIRIKTNKISELVYQKCIFNI